MKAFDNKFLKIILTSFLLILLIKSIFSSEPYNFAGKQNPFLDMIHSHIPGSSMFLREQNNQTLIIFNVYPDSSLNFKFKIYSNISSIQQSFINPNTGLVVGMDFNYNSTDIYVKTFRGDSFFCFFNIESTVCDDYIWDFTEKKYKRNNGRNNLGFRLSNSLIPNGFNSSQGTYFDSNVIDYDFYMGMGITKDYPPGFDIFSMFRWLYIISQNEKWNITLFYGEQNSRDLSETYAINDLSFFREVQYVDGYGLDIGASFPSTHYSIYLSILFVLLIF